MMTVHHIVLKMTPKLEILKEVEMAEKGNQRKRNQKGKEMKTVKGVRREPPPISMTL